MISTIDTKSTKISSSTNLTTWIPAMIDNDTALFNEKYILALEASELSGNISVNSWFNHDAYHSVASSILYADRFLLFNLFSGLGKVFSTS